MPPESGGIPGREGDGAAICPVGVLQKIWDHIRENVIKNWLTNVVSDFLGAPRNKPNISPRFEKPRFSTDSRNRGCFSACSDARPQKNLPHCRTNFQFCFTNGVSDFLCVRRKIAQHFLHVILRNRQIALTPTPGWALLLKELGTNVGGNPLEVRYFTYGKRPKNSPPSRRTVRKDSPPLLIWRGCSRRGFSVAENAKGCVSRLGAPLCDTKPSKTPALWRQISGVTAAGSVSFPQTTTRGPATEQPFSEIRAACGPAHLLHLQVDSVVQLFVAHISYLAPPPSLSPSRASLDSRSGPHLIASPPRLLLKGTALDPGPGSPSRPTHQTASVSAQRLHCMVLATK